MDILASSSNSSIDLLAAQSDDPRSSPVHERNRIFKRSPSPKNAKITPNRNKTLQLQDFYIASPTKSRSISISPARSLAESENVISPWRIRVRVEAEREDEPDDNEIGHPNRKSMSPYRTKSRATTTVVPLNDYADPSSTPTQAGRAKKSTPKRRATPKPPRSRKRVLETVENEASYRLSSSKRLKSGNTVGLDGQEQVLFEDEGTNMLHLDDLVEAAVIDDADHSLSNAGADTEVSTENLLLVTSTTRDTVKENRSSKAQRTTSPFKFRRQGRESSIVQNVPSLSSQAAARRRLLISDFAEPRREFDSIMEGEDFSMVSLSSIPSAQHHLSLRRETVPVPATNTNSEDANSRRPLSRQQSHTSSPNVTPRPGPQKPRRSPRRLNSTVATEDATEQLPLTKALSRSPKYPKLPEDVASPSKSKGSNKKSPSENVTSVESGNDYSRGIGRHTISQSSPVMDISANVADLVDSDLGEDFNEPGVMLPETFEPDEADHVHVELSKQSPQSKQHSQQPLHTEMRNLVEYEDLQARGDQYLEQEPASRVDTEHIPFAATNAQNEVHDVDDRSRLEQSSILQLPQTLAAPSRVFSSPTLPNMIPRRKETNIKSSRTKIATPKLKRIAKAGKALQDVVEPAVEQQLVEIPDNNTIQRQQGQPDDLFSGFSIATRRELRAGLRLGDELAKRQSSLMDITMHTVSSLGQVEYQPKLGRSTIQVTASRSHEIGSLTKDVQSIQARQENIQLPSPERSSNSTENKAESVLIHDNYMHENQKGTFENMSKYDVQKQDTFGEVMEEDAARVADEVEYQDQGFASDSEHDAHEPVNEVTDIWQLAADSSSFLQESVPEKAPLLPSTKQTHIPNMESDHPRHSTEPIAVEDDAESAAGDFEAEPLDTPARVQEPATISDMLTPSATDSSPLANARQTRADFTDFTGLTKDLLQAAASKDRRPGLNERISEERDNQTTPVDKVLQGHRTYQLDGFTTKSFLETSPASTRTRRFPPKRPVSFRPTNRKESWLLDPTRLRKPPSPIKHAEPTLADVLRESASPGSPDTFSDRDQDVQPNHSDSALSDPDSLDHQQQDLSSDGSQSRSSSPGVTDDGLSSEPLVSPVQEYAARPETRTHAIEPNPRHSAVNQISNSSISSYSAAPPSRNIQEKARVNPRTQQARHSPLGQSSELYSQQSSLFSNTLSNTSYDADDTQPTWLSLLTSVATPIINSTKVVTNLAATAFWHSQQQTFYPTRKSASLAPAILTTHQPFNDAHWSVLRMLYTTALESPHNYPLDLTHPCADFSGLEIESMGWKRELKEWELAVVARFLQLLDEDGAVEDAEEHEFDAEDIVKRVFSLWVGMVTRGELDLTEGVAGAWDRRFVGRRDTILQKQQEWLRASRSRNASQT